MGHDNNGGRVRAVCSDSVVYYEKDAYRLKNRPTKNWTALSNFEQMYRVVAETFEEGKLVTCDRLGYKSIELYEFVKIEYKKRSLVARPDFQDMFEDCPQGQTS